jgi:lipopolysaccharide export system permease protein
MPNCWTRSVKLGKHLRVFTILDRYILRQVMAPLGGALAIGLLMLLAERLVRLLDTTMGKQNSFGAVFELIAYLVPHYLGTAFPAALFLGLLFGFSKMSKSQELNAMMAAGLGLHRLARPVLLLALVFSLTSLVIFGWLQPLTRYAYRSVLFDILSIDAFYLAEEGVFMQSGSRTFILDELDRGNGTFRRIFLFDDKGTNGAETMTATDGVLITVPGQTRPVLRLNNGHRLEIERWPTTLTDADVVPARIAEFATTDTPLGKVSKDLFRPRGADGAELYITELLTLQAVPPQGNTAHTMQVELHRRLVNILSMLLLPILAMPFAIGNSRSPRAYRMAIALVLLVGFHEIIQQGALASRTSGYSPWLTLWLPMALLATFAFWQFFNASFRLGGDGIDRILWPIQDAIGAVARRLRRIFGWRPAT